MKRFFLHILLLLLLASPAFGATYYVKNAGDDLKDGLSEGNAWATIAKVNAATFSAGDTIKFNGGDTWAETLQIDCVGTSGNVITFTSYGTGVPEIRSVYLASGSTSSYVTFDDIDVKNSDSGANSGMGFRIIGPCNNLTIQNCKVYECYSDGFYGKDNKDYITFYANEFLDNGTGGAALDSIYGSGINVRGSYNNDLHIHHNRFVDNYRSGALPGADDAIIEWNYVYDSTGSMPGFDPVANRGIIRYNWIEGPSSGGGYPIKVFTPDSYTTYVHHNIFKGFTRGAFVGSQAAALIGGTYYIYNNLFIDSGGPALLRTGCNHMYLKNNIFYNAGVNLSNSPRCYLSTQTAPAPRNCDTMTAGTWHSDYNLYGPLNANAQGFAYLYYAEAGQEAYANFAAWQAASYAQDANSIYTTDTIFTDYAGGDYSHLSATSPGVDAGVSDLGIDFQNGIDPANTDFTTTPPTGATLNQGSYGLGWDMGPYVYQPTGDPGEDDDDPPIVGNVYSEDTDCKAFWDYENDAVDEQNSYDLTANGSPTYSETNIEGTYALLLASASNQYMNRTDANLVDFPLQSADATLDIAIGAWIRLTSEVPALGEYVIYNKDEADKRSIKVYLNASENVCVALGSNGGADTDAVCHASALSTATWYHIGVSYDHSETMLRIVVDDSDGVTVGSDIADNTTMAGKTLNAEDAPLLIGAIGGTPPADILFWWRCEAADFSATDGTLDYSTGDNTATAAGSGEAINSDAAKLGTNGLDSPTAFDSYSFSGADGNDICNPLEGRVGFWFRVNTWVDDAYLFRVIDAVDDYLQCDIDNSDEIRCKYYETGGNQEVLTDASPISVGGWYFLEYAWDDTNNKHKVVIHSAAGAVLENQEESEALTAMGWSGAFTMVVGNGSNKEADIHIDHFIISNDYDRDLYALAALTANYNATGSSSHFDGLIDEMVVWAAPRTATDFENKAKGLYAKPEASGQSASAAAETVTVTGNHVITMAFDREVYVENGTPYFDSNVTCPSGTLRYYYSGKSSTDTYWTAALEAGCRTPTGTDLDFNDTQIHLPTNCIMRDAQDQDVTLTGLDTMDIDNTTYIKVPATSANAWELGSTGDYADFEAFEAAQDLFSDDYLMWVTDTADVVAAGTNGTSGHPITLDGQGFKNTGNVTLGDYYDLTKMRIGSDLVLGVGNNVTNTVVFGTLQVPSGATGCTIDSCTVYGVCDFDETVTVTNTICFSAATDGVNVADGKTVTATYVAYDTADLNATGTFDCTIENGCQSGISDPFHDAGNENFRLHRTNGASLKDAGATTLTDDIDTLSRPRGAADDIGAYERQWTGTTVITNPASIGAKDTGFIYKFMGQDSDSAP